MLPTLYTAWMADLLEGEIPREQTAACERCVMCRPADSPDGVGGSCHFSRETKCCTYLPELVSFGVGHILTRDDETLAEGRRTVVARITARHGVTPLGLKRPRPRQLIDTHGHNLFGRETSLRCPHLLADGHCGIWRYGAPMCSTWYCKFDRGAVGFRFWAALRRLLCTMEERLSWWCLLRLGMEPAVLTALEHDARRAATPSCLQRGDLDAAGDAAAHAQLWGSWNGREEELYRRCAALVDGLSWREAASICGVEAEVLGRAVREAHTALMSRAVPERVRLGRFQITAADDRGFLVVGYSPFDPIRLPKTLMGLLHHFDGRPTAQILDHIDRAGGPRLGLEVVQRLVDVGVLAEA